MNSYCHPIHSGRKVLIEQVLSAAGMGPLPPMFSADAPIDTFCRHKAYRLRHQLLLLEAQSYSPLQQF